MKVFPGRLLATVLIAFATVGTAFTTVGTVSAAENDGLTGRQIMDEIKKRHEKPNEFSTQSVILKDKDGKVTRRKQRHYVKKFPNGRFKYLTIIDAPESVKGVALLMWEKKAGDTDQWIFLPAVGKMKRIVGDNKRNYYMGTDATFEDLTIDSLDHFRFERKRDIVMRGKKLFVIYAYPELKNIKKSTGYDHRRVIVNAETFMIMRVDFFEKRTRRPLKTAYVQEAQPVGGDTWRPKRLYIRNNKGKQSTSVLVTGVNFSADTVPAEIFRHNYLREKKHMR